MGLISDAQAIKAVQRIKNGGKAKLSISQITNISVNMLDARKNLSASEFIEVHTLYTDLRKCNTKMEMDLEEYFDTVFSIIKRFDAIAPYEKYSGGNETEISFLMEELRKQDEPEGQTKPRGSEFDNDVRELLDRDDIQCREDICEAEYNKAIKLIEKPTAEKVQRAYDIMGNLASQFEYVPAMVWMAGFQDEVAENEEQAKYWYKKAAAAGHGEAAYIYATKILQENPSNPDYELAVKYGRIAANKGVESAAIMNTVLSGIVKRMNQTDDDEDDLPESDSQPGPDLWKDLALRLIDNGRASGYITASNDQISIVPELLVKAGPVSEKVHQDMLIELDKDPSLRDSFVDLNLVWASYAGMGAVYHWHFDAEELLSDGIYETLTRERGLFAMDEYVLDTIGIPHESEEAHSLWIFLSHQLCNFIKFYLGQHYGRNDYEGLLIGMKAMYMFGMVYEMNRIRNV